MAASWCPCRCIAGIGVSGRLDARHRAGQRRRLALLAVFRSQPVAALTPAAGPAPLCLPYRLPARDLLRRATALRAWRACSAARRVSAWCRNWPHPSLLTAAGHYRAAPSSPVTIPLKIWNNIRNEKKLEAQQLRLNEARLAALTSQINPHFLFNTLNSVSSLIRTNPEEARQVVYKLSNILRRLLRKHGEPHAAARRAGFHRRLPGHRDGALRRQAALREGDRRQRWTCWCPACCCSR